MSFFFSSSKKLKLKFFNSFLYEHFPTEIILILYFFLSRDLQSLITEFPAPPCPKLGKKKN